MSIDKNGQFTSMTFCRLNKYHTRTKYHLIGMILFPISLLRFFFLYWDFEQTNNNNNKTTSSTIKRNKMCVEFD